MRPRKLSKLKYQFGRLAPKLTEIDIGEALWNAGLIELIESDLPWNRMSKYVETSKMRSLEPEEFESVIGLILKEFATNKGGL
jgi:hypothetical protein